MTEKDEEASAIDTYKKQLEERISKFDAVISSSERAIQLLAESDEARTVSGISEKIRAGEAARRNENGDQKEVQEERRKKERRSKSEVVKIDYL